MHQLHNRLISYSDKVGLTGSINPITKKVIVSDAMLRYISPSQLHQINGCHKMACGYNIYKTSNYPQVYLNTWHLSQLKLFK